MVEAPVGRDDLLDRVATGLRGGDVEVVAGMSVTGGEGVLPLVLGDDVGGGDGGAELGQAGRDGGADPAGGPGHQGHPSVEAHGIGLRGAHAPITVLSSAQKANLFRATRMMKCAIRPRTDRTTRTANIPAMSKL